MRKVFPSKNGSYLHAYDEEEKAASYVNLESEQHHYTSSQLTKKVHYHKQCGNELSTTPGNVHVLSLLIPLEVHANAILQKCGNQTEASKGGKDGFRPSENLKT